MSTTNLAKVIAACLIFSSLSMQMCASSSIPIWEFLTRNEKMSYLYSTFAQLVSVHCKATAATSTLPVNQCKRNLLTYGYEKLQTFSNEQLDAFDPYQRGASELIWSSIMREHPSATLVTTRKPLPIPPATSIIILTHQNPLKPNQNDETPADSTATNAHDYPKNPIFDNDANNKHEYAMDMDIAYGYPSKPAPSPAQVEVFDVPLEQESNKEQTFLTGPHVVRVRPDGRPVEEDQYNPLPTDDDMEAFQLNTAVVLPPTPQPSQVQTAVHAAAGRPTKHRKIATISALKQQYLSNLALNQQLQPPAIDEPVQELQPPLERPRARRQYPAMPPFNGFFIA